MQINIAQTTINNLEKTTNQYEDWLKNLKIEFPKLQGSIRESWSFLSRTEQKIVDDSFQLGIITNEFMELANYVDSANLFAG